MTTMGAIIADMGQVTGTLTTTAGTIVSTVVGQPLLLIPVLMGFVGGGIMLFQKLRHG